MRAHVLLVLAPLALAACSRPENVAPAPRPAVATPTAVAEVADVPDTIEATGAVEAWARVSPGTKLMGRVERVLVTEGDAVRAGQALAVLDARDLDAAIGQASAGVAMAEANLENARAMHRRMTALRERGSATDKNLEDATLGFHVAEAGLAQAQANLRSAQVMAGYATVTTPIAGFVTAKHIDAGDMAAPGMPMFTVEDLSRVKIAVRVPEASVVGMAKGNPATVRIDVLASEVPATVDRVVPAGDPMSRTFEVLLVLDNRDGRIRSGMFARALFARSTRRALVVPQSALVTRGELTGLFVVDADNVARLRWVRLGRVTGTGTEVIAGLAAGERFVTAPPATLADGSPIAAASAQAR